MRRSKRKRRRASTAAPRSSSNLRKELLSVGYAGAFAIIVIVAIVLFFLGPATTGSYVTTGTYIQYEPMEACTLNGCTWNLELQKSMYRNPFSEPSAVCICDGTAVTIPLIQRTY